MGYLSYPREGLTVDYVARWLRCTVLHPAIAVPAALAMNTDKLVRFVPPALSAKIASLLPASVPGSPALQTTATVLACLAVLLSSTDVVNRGFNNNWTSPSDWKWSSEVVLITGGSSGIGASLAQQLLARNRRTTVVIVDYVPLTWTPPSGTTVHFFQCDLSDAAAIRKLCNRVRQDVGNPTVLVNNAGLSRGIGVLDGSYADNEITIRTNLLAPFLLAKEFVPAMARRNHGHIVTVSSMSAIMPPGPLGDYAATKAGLVAMHEALQLELVNPHKATKVRQTLLILSFTRTPLFKGETRQSNFLFPLLDVETVSEAMADTLYSGYGKTIYLPGIMRYVASLVRDVANANYL